MLDRDFYAREADIVARELLGMLLVRHDTHTLRIGRITETEAYLGPHDKAAHTSKGLTARTRVMFGPPGYAYVYLIYGLHHCMNVVTGQDGQGSAVLLRALEPVEGLEGNTRGPGRLCKAMGIDLGLYGHDLCSPGFHLERPPAETPFDIVARPRIGVDYAGEWAAKPLRFYIAGSPWVSHK